ncbi:hypothetical protein [Clostridium botulinum]|uniref:hypothetical protein n=1 Tax=Clostridium botulinum TaxID=1491 RepID=UPI0004AF3700|nr:hypothetical protein [Clostridium botulinum]APQ73161.1 hypothetical protein RSJ9_2727 [Clostridium botulinum]
MAKGTEIKKVTIKIPEDTTIEEVERKACAAYAKILSEMYHPEVIEKIIEGLEKEP